MTTVKSKSGRKAIPVEERKQPVTIYLRNKEIKTIGGKTFIREKLLDYVNFSLLDGNQRN